MKNGQEIKGGLFLSSDIYCCNLLNIETMPAW